MARKVLFQTALTDLETADVEGLGVLRDDEFGNVYRWVKNKGTTALYKAGPCLKIVTSVVAGARGRVINPTGAGTSTASINRCAGIPVTAIGASGSGTGAYGWVQCLGIARASFVGTDTAQSVGQQAICTSAAAGASRFAVALDVTNVGDTTAAAYAYKNFVELINTPTTGGASTPHSGTVQIHCL